MANQEQLEILYKGVSVWNKWREENPNFAINLDKADLKGIKLSGYRDTGGINLDSASLVETDFSEASLGLANFKGANLAKTNFSKAFLTRAYFWEANLTGSDLSGAILNEASLEKANLVETVLDNTLLESTMFGHTIIGNTNLSTASGLDEALHFHPSTIGIDTIQLSKGRIPEAFLRGCGLPDWEIESAKLHNPDLTNEEIGEIEYRIHDLRTTRAIKVSPLFISYSHADKDFVDTLEKGLNEKGIRFWRDIHDMKAGRIETQIESAIRQNPTVLLILSKNSMSSDWVQHEVRKARELEKELGCDALCPIALDDDWKSSRWPQRVMEQVMEYNILDFSKWEDEATFNSKFAKLLSGLDLFYKKPE